jgi:hypothetical protein
MKQSPSSLVAVVVMLAVCSTAAQAQGVNVTARLLDFDVAEPARENYRDTHAGTGIVNDAITRALQDLKATALAPVRDALSGPNRLGPGMTARDIEIMLGTPGAPSLLPTGQAKGRMTIPVTGNWIDLTSTHPASRGPSMDPRMRIAFDLTLTIDMYLGTRPPHLRASAAILQPKNPVVTPLNVWAEIGLGIDDILSSLGGTQSIEARINEGFGKQRAEVTNTFNSGLAANAGLLSMPKGYTFNGGRIEPDQVIVAGYRVVPYANDRVTLLATWPKDLGAMMNDCRPVGMGASWQAGPRPYSGVAKPPRGTATVLNVNSRAERRGEFICSTILQAPKGAPLSFAWADPVRVTVASPNPAVLKTVLVARPSGWVNPVVPTAPEYALALTKESQVGTGRQLDAAAQAQKSPLDPVTRSGVEERVNPVVQQPESPVLSTVPMTSPAPTTTTTVPTTAPVPTTRGTLISPAPAATTVPMTVPVPTTRGTLVSPAPAATTVPLTAPPTVDSAVRMPGTLVTPDQVPEVAPRTPSEGP